MTDERILKALNNARTKFRQGLEALNTVEALLSGELTEGQQAKRLLDIFSGMWGEAHGGQKYPVAGPKDMATFRRLLKSATPEEVVVLIGHFFQSRDKFLENTGRTVGVFASQIAKLMVNGKRAVKAPRVDWREECREHHKPECPNVHFHVAKMGDPDRVNLFKA